MQDPYEEKVIEPDGHIWYKEKSKMDDWLFEQAKEYRENDPERRINGMRFKFNEYKEPLIKEFRLRPNLEILYELKDIAESNNINIYQMIFDLKEEQKLIFDPLLLEVEDKFFKDLLEILRKKVDW